MAARDHLRQLVELPSAVRQGLTGIARLRRRARERERHPQLARVLHPPKTFINHKVLSPRRTFATATIPFADVKATAKELGVTIKDLVLATAAGALRELLLRYDGRADEPLIASVPVSIDSSPQRISGNALSTLLVHPIEWSQALHATGSASPYIGAGPRPRGVYEPAMFKGWAARLLSIAS